MVFCFVIYGTKDIKGGGGTIIEAQLYYLKCMEELGTSSSIGKKFQVYISFLH
jgi:hypothetical protein